MLQNLNHIQFISNTCTSVNPAISDFDLTGVRPTSRSEICPAWLRFFLSSSNCSRLLSTTLQTRRGASVVRWRNDVSWF